MVVKSSALPGGHNSFGEDDKNMAAELDPLILIFAGESLKKKQ